MSSAVILGGSFVVFDVGMGEMSCHRLVILNLLLSIVAVLGIYVGVPCVKILSTILSSRSVPFILCEQ
jgi:hypothetical protein